MKSVASHANLGNAPRYIAGGRATKMTPKLIAILTQYRENLEGGDPWMSHVSTDDVRKLLAAGLIESCERPKYQRAHVPTAAGLALLELVTAACESAPCATESESGAA